jgi:hypothetical protein
LDHGFIDHAPSIGRSTYNNLLYYLTVSKYDGGQIDCEYMRDGNRQLGQEVLSNVVDENSFGPSAEAFAACTSMR